MALCKRRGGEVKRSPKNPSKEHKTNGMGWATAARERRRHQGTPEKEERDDERHGDGFGLGFTITAVTDDSITIETDQPMKDTIDGRQTGILLEPETRFEVPVGSGCGIATPTMMRGCHTPST